MSSSGNPLTKIYPFNIIIKKEERNKMKKLIFSAVSLDTGGIEKSLVTLLNYLSHQRSNGESKYEITLVLEKKEGAFLSELNKNIKIIEYSPSKNKFVPWRKFINLCKRLKFESKYKNKFDFACSYATYSLPAAFVATASAENNCLWVHSEYMSVFKNNEKEYINFFEKLHIQKFALNCVRSGRKLGNIA